VTSSVITRNKLSVQRQSVWNSTVRHRNRRARGGDFPASSLASCQRRRACVLQTSDSIYRIDLPSQFTRRVIKGHLGLIYPYDTWTGATDVTW